MGALVFVMLLKPLSLLFYVLGSVYFPQIMAAFFTPHLPGRIAEGLALMFTILLGIVIYVAVLILIGGLKEADLQAIPRLGSTLVRWAKRFRLIKR